MATLIPLNTSNWSNELGPSNSRDTGKWIGVHNQTPEKKGNSSGALVSDFQLLGDFTFSGLVTPTSMDYDDNDIIGIVFGWENELNHYRLGWTQTQAIGVDDRSYTDITGRTGLFLIQEVNGHSSTLFNINDLFWTDDTTYEFNISREDNLLSIDFGGTAFEVESSQFINGKVGIYTESQTATFAQLQVNGNVIQVPEPMTIAIFSVAMLGLVTRKFSRS
ncbi:PEP-CTERM sorting domain-containing protein [Thalassotalea profundi]|uniref:PEP-CTERM sorting domain-containing protein n=1 Tax=Thalassotalea profundi TaxID=2036687 RepID=A0ABQ3IM73_9GAMM|nr:PEP-CTERM sorting domain-containing protein [Thalassotalea profundi]GHE88345.1 hypothetical protein GCM10011501_17190 [Thalassotalea profundi]